MKYAFLFLLLVGCAQGDTVVSCNHSVKNEWENTNVYLDLTMVELNETVKYSFNNCISDITFTGTKCDGTILIKADARFCEPKETKGKYKVTGDVLVFCLDGDCETLAKVKK